MQGFHGISHVLCQHDLNAIVPTLRKKREKEASRVPLRLLSGFLSGFRRILGCLSEGLSLFLPLVSREWGNEVQL